MTKDYVGLGCRMSSRTKFRFGYFSHGTRRRGGTTPEPNERGWSAYGPSPVGTEASDDVTAYL